MGNNGFYREFGRLGEEFVTSELLRRGYAAEWIGECSDYDLLVDGRMKVEVKSATPSAGSPGRNRSDRWQFSLRRHGLPVDEDLMILVCWGEDLEEPLATFIIPGAEVDERLTKIDITSRPDRYRGKWTAYRGRWDLVDQVLEDLPAGQVPFEELFKVPEEIEIPF